MTKTQWSGGITGLETMPVGTISMYYCIFTAQIPIIDYDDTANGSGYYDGDTDNTHQLQTGFRSIEKCTVSGSESTVSIVSTSSGRFKINISKPGYVLVWYLPYSDELYFSNPNQELYDSNVRGKLVSIKPKHIEEILGALNSICDEIQVARRSYSISQYTGQPKLFTGSLDSHVPITKHLFSEIRAHLLYLNNYVITNNAISATIPQIDLAAYNYNMVSAHMIEQFRNEINLIEEAI